MACKQKPVSRLYLVGKSHECQRIATEGESHPPTDNLWRFLHVIDSSNGETPVGNWAPEVRTGSRHIPAPLPPSPGPGDEEGDGSTQCPHVNPRKGILTACPGAVFVRSVTSRSGVPAVTPRLSVKDWSSVPCHQPFPGSSCPGALSARSLVVLSVTGGSAVPSGMGGRGVPSGTGWGGVPSHTMSFSSRGWSCSLSPAIP